MKTLKKIAITTTLLCLIFCYSFLRVAIAQQPEVKIDDYEQKLVVDSIVKFMKEKYVFPDVGEQMGDLIKKNLRAGVYNDIDEPREFAAKITEDLRSVSNDKHIGLRYTPEMIAMIKKAEDDKDNKELKEYENKKNKDG